MRWWRLIVTIGLLLIVIVGPIAYAQDDGLTDEQMAWIGRIAEARAIREAYTSYVEHGSTRESQSIEITLGTLNQTVSEEKAMGYVATFVQGENYNVNAKIMGQVKRVGVQPNGQEVTTKYYLSAEARVVDDVIYLNAAVDASDGPDVPSLPVGWIIVDDVRQYADLNLDDLLDDDKATPLEDEDLMRAAAADVTLDVMTLDDGTTADIITVTFGRAGLEALLAGGEDTVDPLTQALLDQVSEDFVALIQVMMDADNNPLRASMLMSMNAEDVDAHFLSPDQFPDGMVLDFRYGITETLIYQDANVPGEPIEAPVDLIN